MLPENPEHAAIHVRHDICIVYLSQGLVQVCEIGRFTFERIHNTKEQIYFYERAENHKAKERLFESFK